MSLQNWGTPRWLFDLLDKEFNFTLDVCAEAWSAKCPDFFTAENDGLAQVWTGNVWCNPPYNDPKPWMEKALRHVEHGVNSVLLVPANVGDVYFQDLSEFAEVRLIKRRLTYAPPPEYVGKLMTARFPSAVVIYGPEVLQSIKYWDVKKPKEAA